MMPQPVHPRESFDTILFGNWDCHEEDGKVVITRQPGTINMPDNAGRVPSFLQTSRAPSVTKPLRQTPEQWPSSLCFAGQQKPVTGPSLSSSKVQPSNTSAALRK
ncbi:uncharacterized protein LAESUDRAFT_728374 [Laetiporus sulphureus 93-53]|uniref:Uncharacterized protein n=1 Tax=Laetiporus sulphureus 93-53 TaxID=1314785 RepID=A0A165D4X0_9APHY|nr:uncharacterized protein LAESUDRAFT_728374 [Laetiporus sulphureus 93-53]KZT04159.1 hypothetical protein LAESUDRAFT_728374 [Laetiporus sulphureus 93-53]